MSRHKVVFLDIDGTIVNAAGEIPASTKEAIRRAKANGHKMVICSGRSRFQIYDELLNLGFSGIVGAAGAFVEADGEEIFHAYIDEEHRRSTTIIWRATDFSTAIRRMTAWCSTGRAARG